MLGGLDNRLIEYRQIRFDDFDLTNATILFGTQMCSDPTLWLCGAVQGTWVLSCLTATGGFVKGTHGKVGLSSISTPA